MFGKSSCDFIFIGLRPVPREMLDCGTERVATSAFFPVSAPTFCKNDFERSEIQHTCFQQFYFINFYILLLHISI